MLYDNIFMTNKTVITKKLYHFVLVYLNEVIINIDSGNSLFDTSFLAHYFSNLQNADRTSVSCDVWQNCLFYFAMIPSELDLQSQPHCRSQTVSATVCVVANDSADTYNWKFTAWQNDWIAGS